jgi:hypothetical protein
MISATTPPAGGRLDREPRGALRHDALARLQSAVEVYEQGQDNYWLPVARRRIAELQAKLAKLQQ